MIFWRRTAVLLFLLFRSSVLWGTECCQDTRAFKLNQTFVIPDIDALVVEGFFSFNHELVEKLMCFAYKNLANNSCLAIFAQYHSEQNKVSFLAEMQFMTEQPLAVDDASYVLHATGLPKLPFCSICKIQELVLLDYIEVRGEHHNEAVKAVGDVDLYNSHFNAGCTGRAYAPGE